MLPVPATDEAAAAAAADLADMKPEKSSLSALPSFDSTAAAAAPAVVVGLPDDFAEDDAPGDFVKNRSNRGNHTGILHCTFLVKHRTPLGAERSGLAVALR